MPERLKLTQFVEMEVFLESRRSSEIVVIFFVRVVRVDSLGEIRECRSPCEIKKLMADEGPIQ